MDKSRIEIGYGLFPVAGRELYFRLRKQRSFGVRQVRLYDCVIFPVVNMIETTVARPPIGQSLIAIARAE